jgi:hypothetical protein
MASQIQRRNAAESEVRRRPSSRRDSMRIARRFNFNAGWAMPQAVSLKGTVARRQISPRSRRPRVRFVPMKLHPEWLQFSPGRALSGVWLEPFPFHCLHSFAKRSGGLLGRGPVSQKLVGNRCNQSLTRMAKEWRQGNRVWSRQGSDFGFGVRICFGFRNSDFGFDLAPLTQE